MQFSGDGRWLLTNGNEDPTVHLWNLASSQAPEPREVHVVEPHVQDALISNDGRFVAATGWDGDTSTAVNVWELDDWGPREPYDPPLRAHDLPVTTIQFSSASQWLMSHGFREATTRLWDLTARQWRVQPLAMRASHRLAFSPAGDWFALGGRSTGRSTITLWNARSTPPSIRGRIPLDLEGPLGSLQFCGGTRLVAAGTWNDALSAWDIADQNVIPARKIIEGGIGHIERVICSDDGGRVAMSGSAGDGNQVRVVQLADQHDTSHTFIGGRGKLRIMELVGSGDRLVTAGAADVALTVWALSGTMRPKRVERLSGLRGGFAIAAASPDGRWIAASSAKSPRVSVWKLGEPRTARRLTVGRHMQWADVAFSADSRRLALRALDHVELWRVVGDRWIAVDLPVKLARPSDVRFSPKGSWLAVAARSGGERDFLLLDPRDPRTSAVVHLGDGGDLRTLAFSPDERWLAAIPAGSDDVTLWDLHTENPARFPIRLHMPGVQDAVFSRDARWLGISGDRGTEVWSLDLEALTAAACRSVARPLSFAERVQIFGGADGLGPGAGDPCADQPAPRLRVPDTPVARERP